MTSTATPSPNKTRARSTEAKDERRQQLLFSARTLLQQKSYADVTMAEIAAHAGLAKGTTYLYFSSKEFVFIHILIDELTVWISQLQMQLENYDDTTFFTNFPRIFAQTLGDRPLLRELLAILHSTLESNLDEKEARMMKEAFAALLQGPASFLDKRMQQQGAQAGAGLSIFLRAHALCVGLSQMAKPPPAVAAILEEPSLSFMKVNFVEHMESALRDWIRGMLPVENPQR